MTKLREDFKKVAGETIRELYGYYNTETGSSLLGQEPLSQEDRRALDQEIEAQLDTTLSLLEKFTGMSTSEYSDYVSESFTEMSKLFGS